MYFCEVLWATQLKKKQALVKWNEMSASLEWMDWNRARKECF